LALGFFPGFQWGAIVWKTLMPESSLLGWFVSAGTLLYVPFISAVLLAFVQLFGDIYITISVFLYTIAYTMQGVIFFTLSNKVFADPTEFKQRTQKYDRLFQVLLLGATVLFVLFIYYASTNNATTMETLRSIGFLGFYTFTIRIIFSLLTTALFTGDGIMFILLKLQSSNEHALEHLIKYEDAMSHFFHLKDNKKLSQDGIWKDSNLSRESSTSSIARSQTLTHQRKENSTKILSNGSQRKNEGHLNLEMVAL
jgi:hypothetical protein